MVLERIESAGLAHYSYLIAQEGRAIVIDPRRDCEIYIERAESEGFRITDVLETHRNEDYVAGSVELASRTGADIWHADSQLPYAYGSPAQDGQSWKIGNLELKAIHSPGHTPGSMSYLLLNPDGTPWMLFCGDALFAGEVGRVDLAGPEMMKQLAGMLHDTLFRKLLPLGDGVIVCPAHGPGSVCGSAISDRVWTSIGLEKKLNPMLGHTHKDDFIAAAARQLEFAPYFLEMERINVEGPPLLGGLPSPPALSPGEFERLSADSTILDVREEIGFGAAHISSALSVWRAGLPAFTGWFVPYDKPILLVTEGGFPDIAVRDLIRIGYDNIIGYLAGGMHAWHQSGRESDSIQMMIPAEACAQMDWEARPWVLDVRNPEELRTEGSIKGAHNYPLTSLSDSMGAVPMDRQVYIFCGSGHRAMVAAGLLKREGWKHLVVVSGGFSGWSSATCPCCT